MKQKIFDCITFFKENFVTNLRFDILNSVVDFFVVCESNFDHRNNIKGFNFNLFNQKYKSKIIYLKLHEPFKSYDDFWANQASQRNSILKKIDASGDDYIFFSDPDEIPNPDLLKNFILEKKYGIFMQKHFMYKFNIFAEQYSPWEGTRVAKFKDIISIDYLRQKILKKNIEKWWRPDKEKNIQIINNGGWHFNNFLSAEELSIKLRTFAHSEFSGSEYSDPKIIEKKISSRQDLFGRNHYFKKLDSSSLDSLPKHILKNLNLYKNYFE